VGSGSPEKLRDNPRAQSGEVCSGSPEKLRDHKRIWSMFWFNLNQNMPGQECGVSRFC
jgi:hypothetical protein